MKRFRNNRARAGAIANRKGSQFENAFQTLMRAHGWHVVPIEDGCRYVGSELIKVRQPFDFVIMGPNREVVFVDTKRRGEGKRVVPSMFSSKSCLHQIRELSKIRAKGQEAGFVVYLDETDELFYVPIPEFIPFKDAKTVAIPWGKFRDGRLDIKFTEESQRSLFDAEEELVKFSIQFR